MIGRARFRRHTKGAQWPPRSVLVVAVVALVVLVLPILAVLVRAPWGDMWSLLTEPSARSALRLSLESAVITTAVAVVLGVPLATALATDSLPGARLMRLLVVVPMVLPPVVVGTALLALLGRRGMIGRYLSDWFGWVPTYTFTGVVIAQLAVAMPFMVVAVEAALRERDRDAEEAAQTLGAGPLQVFWQVTLPGIRTGILAGAAMCFARSLGEFGATITFAGNVEGQTQTMPLAIYLALQRDDAGAIAMSVGLIVLSVIVLVALRGRWVPALASAMR